MHLCMSVCLQLCSLRIINFVFIDLSTMATRFINCKSVLKIVNHRRKMFATSVHKVVHAVKPLSQLVDRLKAGLPATNLVYVCARNALNNKILYNFYTDGWPDFSSVT
jgi:site-specific recombinase